MQKIKSIGALSLGKVLGVMYALLGLVFGIVATIVIFLGNALFTQINGSVAVFAIVFIVVVPILYGVLGFIFGALAGWIFNLATGWVGGLEIEFEESGNPSKPAA